MMFLPPGEERASSMKGALSPRFNEPGYNAARSR